MNATFTHRDFLRMAHLELSALPIGQFKNQVSLTFAPAYRSLVI
jgi:hypothetical protein